MGANQSQPEAPMGNQRNGLEIQKKLWGRPSPPEKTLESQKQEFFCVMCARLLWRQTHFSGPRLSSIAGLTGD